jgi:hypothetical protein
MKRATILLARALAGAIGSSLKTNEVPSAPTVAFLTA